MVRTGLCCLGLFSGKGVRFLAIFPMVGWSEVLKFLALVPNFLPPSDDSDA